MASYFKKKTDINFQIGKYIITPSGSRDPIFGKIGQRWRSHRQI